MVCDTKWLEGQTQAQRKKQIEDILARLEGDLTAGRAGVRVDKVTGAVAFTNWGDDKRGGVSDACAYRKLSAKGSWALRQAVAKAEAMAGRKVNEKAVASGTHSHDGGATWHPGHKK